MRSTSIVLYPLMLPHQTVERPASFFFCFPPTFLPHFLSTHESFTDRDCALPLQRTFSFGKRNVGPLHWTHMAPILWPTSIASSTDLPSPRAPRNPPANASPAPFVSTIWDDSSLPTA